MGVSKGGLSGIHREATRILLHRLLGGSSSGFHSRKLGWVGLACAYRLGCAGHCCLAGWRVADQVHLQAHNQVTCRKNCILPVPL